MKIANFGPLVLSHLGHLPQQLVIFGVILLSAINSVDIYTVFQINVRLFTFTITSSDVGRFS